MDLQFKKILVIQNARSKSTRAIELAVELASESGGKVLVVDFVNKPTWVWRELMDEDDWMDKQLDARAEAIHCLISKAGINDEFVDVEAIDGRPIQEIVVRVIRGNYDLVVKDAMAESAEIFFGSLDMRLMRFCPAPVLLTRPESKVGFKKILAAIDPEVDPDCNNLNHEIIRQASGLARLNAAELHVVSAWQSPKFDFDTSGENIASYCEQRNQVERKALLAMKATMERAPLQAEPRNVHFCNDDAHSAIVNVTDNIKPDLLVIGSQARIGIPGLLVGNIAEKVLRQVECAVMTMKPVGFVSPIVP